MVQRTRNATRKISGLSGLNLAEVVVSTLPVLPSPSPRRWHGIVGTTGAGIPATSTGTPSGASLTLLSTFNPSRIHQVAGPQEGLRVFVEQHSEFHWIDGRHGGPSEISRLKGAEGVATSGAVSHSPRGDDDNDDNDKDSDDDGKSICGEARMAEELVALEMASRQHQQPTDLLVDQNGKLFWGDSSSWIGWWDYTTNAWHTNGDSSATASSNPWARYSQCGLQPLVRCRLYEA